MRTPSGSARPAQPRGKGRESRREDGRLNENLCGLTERCDDSQPLIFSTDEEGGFMIPIVVAGVVAAGVVGALGLGVMQIMRPRRMSIVDYPELPAPKPEDLQTEGQPTQT